MKPLKSIFCRGKCEQTKKTKYSLWAWSSDPAKEIDTFFATRAKRIMPSGGSYAIVGFIFQGSASRGWIHVIIVKLVQEGLFQKMNAWSHTPSCFQAYIKCFSRLQWLHNCNPGLSIQNTHCHGDHFRLQPQWYTEKYDHADWSWIKVGHPRYFAILS